MICIGGLPLAPLRLLGNKGTEGDDAPSWCMMLGPSAPTTNSSFKGVDEGIREEGRIW